MSRTPPDRDQSDPVFSVSQLNREARFLLEGHFPAVIVEGELSNLARPASGHWYFTLKDSQAQVRCAMFRNRNMLVRFRPEDGASIRLRARLSLYEGRGDYQLIVDKMEPQGDGALQQAFEALKTRLRSEGLFDAERKRPLPEHIRHIGVITSPTGAAIRDILITLRRRFPAIRVTILPVSVQGKSSAPEMISALTLANAGQGCLSDLDVVLISRGGGSIEDLWSFNDEALARAIHDSELPVVSAVGHEVDFTIADFVADLRAATPTAAAELLSPSQDEYMGLFRAYEQQFLERTLGVIRQGSQRLQWLQKRLRHPGRRLQDQAQTLDRLETRMQRALQAQIQQTRTRLQQLDKMLHKQTPLALIKDRRQDLNFLRERLQDGINALLAAKAQELARQSHGLHTISPLATLSRGYAISFDQNRDVLRSVSQLTPGSSVRTRLHDGEFTSIVSDIHPGDAK